MEHYTIEVFKREDDKFAWHIVEDNGQIVATDGGQGYENRNECVEMAKLVTSDQFEIVIES